MAKKPRRGTVNYLDLIKYAKREKKEPKVDSKKEEPKRETEPTLESIRSSEATAKQKTRHTVDFQELKKQAKPTLIVVVEGTTDKTILQSCLEKPLQNVCRLQFVVTHGDTMTGYDGDFVRADTIVSYLTKEIQKFIDSELMPYEQKIFNPDDVFQIIQIIDTDGAWIHETDIVVSEDADCPHRKAYLESTVVVGSHEARESIKKRNEQKRNNVNVLRDKKSLIRPKSPAASGKGPKKKRDYVPYSMYYMSCNIDHVVHSDANLSKTEKIDKARKFADAGLDLDALERLQDFTAEYLEIEGDPSYSQASDIEKEYRASWLYITKEGPRSLERHTNLHLIMDRLCSSEEEFAGEIDI